jgi:hypothetical protein
MLIQDHRQVMILKLESLASSTAVVVPGLLDCTGDKTLMIVATVVGTSPAPQ